MLVAFIHALLVMVNKELRMLSSGEGLDGTYQKSLFPMTPALAVEAEGVAGHSTAEKLQEAAAEVVGTHQERPGPMARVRNAAKRRRKRK
jgi:hypothetical protein